METKKTSEKKMNHILGVYIFSFTILFLITEIYSSQVLLSILKISVLLFIVFSLFSLKGIVAKIVYALLFLSILIVVTTKSYDDLLGGILINLPIVAIFVIAPILGITVKTGDYIQSLKVLLTRYRNNAFFFYVSYLILSHIFAMLLNIGSVIISLELMKSSNITSKRLIATSLNRGFGLMMFWSPYLGIMILILSLFNLEWTALVFKSFGFIVIAMVVAVLTELPYIIEENNRLQEISTMTEDANEWCENKANAWKKVTELAGLLFITMFLIILLERLSNVGFLLAVAITSLVFPFLWSLSKGTFTLYKKELKAHITYTLPNLNNEFTMFIIAGVFSYLFVNSPYSNLLTHYLNLLFGSSTYLMITAISTAIILSGIIGAHPAVLVTILAISIVPEEIGLTPMAMAVLLVGSLGLSVSVSLSTAVNGILALELNEKPNVIALKWNWLYIVILYILFTPYIIIVIL